METPWAVDARAKNVDTTYRITDDNTVEQIVDTRGVTFPIVADPTVVYHWYGLKTTYFNKGETARLAVGGGTARVVLGAVPGLNYMTGAITIWAGSAVAAGACVAVVSTYANNAAYPTYQRGSRCR